MSELVKSYVDFWLDKEALNDYLPKNNADGSFSIDLLQLAAYRRIVSNFVFILTHKDIEVQFYSNSSESFTTGKKIYLSASIKNKKDFDWTVGLALHEASHILLTEFAILTYAFAKIPIPLPATLKQKTIDKNLSQLQITDLCKWVWNFIEDRYVDSYVFKNAPGYRGYYKALYDKYWNSQSNSFALKSRIYRIPTLDAYQFRIINFTNPETDLTALPDLDKIAELIDISNILNVSQPAKRLDLAYQVVEVIVDNIQKQENQESNAFSTIKLIHGKLKPDSIPTNTNPKSSFVLDDMGDVSEFDESDIHGFIDNFNEQKNLISHNYLNIKTPLVENEAKILDVIEKSNISLKPVGSDLSCGTISMVDCVVAKKMTKQLIESGTKIFPLALSDWRIMTASDVVSAKLEESVSNGFILGKVLGRKLQIRGEDKITKYTRKSSGKIERRLLSDIGVSSENIFSRINVEHYNKTRLHISVDASGSMVGSKWSSTMTCVVAICVAASMVENLDVSVSFRSTIRVSSGFELPYVVLAYDSSVDKVSKIKQLFPLLVPRGSTPEGLAFEAIMDEFIVGRKSSEQDHYFLNISDGEPCYSIASGKNNRGLGFIYAGEEAAKHTKAQIAKMRVKGVNIMSYFIKSNEIDALLGYMSNKNTAVYKKRQLTLKELFVMMYGNDSRFIDIGSVLDIAKTINNLFLIRRENF